MTNAMRAALIWAWMFLIVAGGSGYFWVLVVIATVILAIPVTPITDPRHPQHYKVCDEDCRAESIA